MCKVPVLFEDYVAHINARPCDTGSRCEGCGRPATYTIPAAGRERDAMCEGCLRNFHGHDHAQEFTVRALLGGAVKGALKGYVSAALIREAVNDALDEEMRQEERYYTCGELKAA